MELNLRPASVARAHELTRRLPFFILAAACFLLCLLGWGFYYLRAASLERRATASVSVKVEAMRRLATQMDAVRKQTTALDAVATPLTDAVNDRTFWVEIMEDLNVRLPKENIWITELVGLSGGKVIGGEPRAGRDGSRRRFRRVAPTPVKGAQARGSAGAGARRDSGARALFV